MATTLVDLTPDSLVTMQPPENGAYELDEGELIFVSSAGYRHERIKSRILTLLFAWQSRFKVGRVFAESTFTLGPRTARIPDVSVVLMERLISIPEEDIAIPIAPDLAVEVISKSESPVDVEKKVRQYLAAGVQEVWQVFPEEQLVRLRWADGTEDFKNHEPLRSHVLSGFEATVNQFFAD